MIIYYFMFMTVSQRCIEVSNSHLINGGPKMSAIFKMYRSLLYKYPYTIQAVQTGNFLN